MPFSEFEQQYLAGRIAGGRSRQIEASIMAHAYYLLSNNRQEKDAAKQFIDKIEEQENQKCATRTNTTQTRMTPSKSL